MTCVDNSIILYVSISRKRHVRCLNSLYELLMGYLEVMSSSNNLDTFETRHDRT